MKWEGLLNLEFRIQNAEWEEEREKEKGLRTEGFINVELRMQN